MNNNNKILLINRGNSDNFGDQAINLTMTRILHAKGYDVVFQDLLSTSMTNKNYLSVNKELSFVSWLKSIIYFFLPVRIIWLLKNYKIFKSVNKATYKAVIIGGGQLINNNKLFPISLFLWTKLLSRKKSKIFLFGVGSDSNFGLLNKFFYKEAFKNITRVFVRDDHSSTFLKNHFHVTSYIIPDVAFIFRDVYDVKNNDYKDKVLYGVTSYKRYRKYNKKINLDLYYSNIETEVLELYKKYKENLNLFYSTQADLKSVKFIQSKILKKTGIYINISIISTLDDFISKLNAAKLIISQRMHALLLGLVLNSSIRPIILSDKIKAFQDNYNENNFDFKNIKNEVYHGFDLLINELEN